ncbi:hypothetical protein J7E83_19730 [Arthrobacter sp. ISL-48]|uniref:CU044_2847 family protein n=1 Tax=Arthrobacter sp. ISL-48 TaxID=2819110 RepID=UPI001BE4FCC5|nr:CU044_2847 family protein [Arthrobacter sp. ISL-48]MBT2534317.1 hypothetical protein [Arthrobacter sp. ISL-48]
MERIIVNDAGKPWFAVEVQGPESPLRGAHEAISNAVVGIADVGSVIAKSCTDIMGALKAELSGVLPDEVELSFGVSLGGEASLPLISKASSEATFTVRVCWKPDTGN